MNSNYELREDHGGIVNSVLDGFEENMCFKEY